MKIIFLDIDGVLNYENSKNKVEEEKVKLLKEIVDRTGAEIVLSSDWRYWWEKPDDDFKLLIDKLNKFGLKLISKTPETAHGYRGAEIHQWLNEWTGESVERFVILDDNIDMKPYMDRLAWTDFKYGLSKRAVKRSVKLLGEKDYASDIAKKIKADLLHGIKPKDCKYCYGASAGAMGVHYSCGCEKSMRYGEYPLVMCPKDCKYYVKESENGL